MYDTPEFMAKVLNAYGLDYTQQKVMCPFHGDINPSMSVDLAKNRVYCFGCQKSFTAQQFVQESEPELNGLTIFKRLAEIEKGTKIVLDKKHIQVNSDLDFEQLRIQAEDYYYTLPRTDWNADWTDELDYMVDRGFSPGLLNACGAKINYNTYYPIVFPIKDNGDFKGWVSRTTDPKVEGERKYLYNRGFRRKLCLPGKYTKGMPLIIVEGYMDMLKIMQEGARNIAALFGWKASQEQVEKLKNAGIEQIISALDNDEKGKEGHKYLESLNFEVSRWHYRNGQKDPGDQPPADIQKNLKHFKIPRSKRWFL